MQPRGGCLDAVVWAGHPPTLHRSLRMCCTKQGRELIFHLLDLTRLREVPLSILRMRVGMKAGE
jgi:hypothetical protein